MRTKSKLTASRLREVLDYCPATGVFTWKVDSKNNVKAGDIAGHVTKAGYRRIVVDGFTLLAHRLAWLHVHGVWPDGQLDHRNEDKDDNRLANLRPATHVQQQHNRSRPHRDNASGFLGVNRVGHYDRWRAAIKTNGKWRHLGCFGTPEEASAAYVAAKSALHPFWTGAIQPIHNESSTS